MKNCTRCTRKLSKFSKSDICDYCRDAISEDIIIKKECEQDYF